MKADKFMTIEVLKLSHWQHLASKLGIDKVISYDLIKTGRSHKSVKYITVDTISIDSKLKKTYIFDDHGLINVIVNGRSTYIHDNKPDEYRLIARTIDPKTGRSKYEDFIDNYIRVMAEVFGEDYLFHEHKYRSGNFTGIRIKGLETHKQIIKKQKQLENLTGQRAINMQASINDDKHSQSLLIANLYANARFLRTIEEIAAKNNYKLGRDGNADYTNSSESQN